jgi:pimeloyl-ACP methyl ester carboxylesterase
MSLQATPQLAAQLQSDQERVRQGVLHPDCSAVLYPHTTPTCRGVILLLHGFTAGPWQFRAICKQLSEAGFACYAARLPGHGAMAAAKGSAASISPHLLPTSSQANLFAQCADEVLAAAYELAQALNVPLMLLGFSAGGALAADLILRGKAPIARAVLVAPFVRPLGRARRLFFRAIRHVPFGGRLIDRVVFRWKEHPNKTDAWVRPGHSHFKLGHVSALFAYVQTVKASTLDWATPTQFILTAIDDKVDAAACRRLARSGKHPHPVWWFSADQKVPHAMLSPEENNNADSRAQIYRIVLQFLGDGVPASNS